VAKSREHRGNLAEYSEESIDGEATTKGRVVIDRTHIIREVKRIADANGGKPPGVQVFERETGIKQSDWYPDTWLRWSDALEEAGYPPNKLQGRIGDEVLIEKYMALVRELRRFPVIGEIRRKAKTISYFPATDRLIVLAARKT